MCYVIYTIVTIVHCYYCAVLHPQVFYKRIKTPQNPEVKYLFQRYIMYFINFTNFII